MRAPRLLAGLLLVGTVSVVGPAHGQVARVDWGAGELGLRFDGTRSRVIDTSVSNTADFVEWLQIPLSGSLFDRRIFSYDLNLRPTLQQRNQSEFVETLAGRQLDMAFRARLLSAQPINLAVSASRGTGSSGGGFGSQRDFVNTIQGVTLFWRNRFFPASVEYTRRSADEEWINVPGATALRVGYDLERLQLLARSSKATVNAQRIVYDDRVGPNDMDTWTVFARHEFRWGRGSRLASSFDDLSETGRTERSRRTWSERLRLVHGDWLNSDWHYRRSFHRTGNASSLSEGYGSGFQGRIGRWANLGLRYSHYVSRVGSARNTLRELTPSLRVQFGLPWRARLTAGGSLTFEGRTLEGDTLPSVPVVDEAHTVPPGRSFTLDETDVALASVTVTSADGTVTYTLETDYVLVEVGPVVRVDVPPGSRVEVGATVLVSYRFRARLSERPEAQRAEYDVSLAAGPVLLRHRRRRRDARDGDPLDLPTRVGLSDYDESRTSLEFRDVTSFGRIDLSASLHERERLSRETQVLDAGISYTPPSLGQMQASFSLYGSDSRTGGLRARSASLHTSVAWSLTRTLWLRGTSEGFVWRQTDTGTQRFLSGGLTAIWKLDFNEVELRYAHHRRDFVTLHQVDRFSLGFRRRF